MAVSSIIPSNYSPLRKKFKPKLKQIPLYSEKILKAEAERKAKERKILEMVGRQRAKKAALLAKNLNIVQTSTFRIY